MTSTLENNSSKVFTKRDFGKIFEVLENFGENVDEVSLRDTTFSRLLKTFSTTKWSGRDLLSPPEVARHGWFNSDFDTIQCKTCKQLIVCRLKNISDSEEQLLISRYREELVKSHKESCPWKIHITDESCYRFPLLSEKSILLSFRKRLLTFTEKNIKVVTESKKQINLAILYSSVKEIFFKSEGMATTSCKEKENEVIEVTEEETREKELLQHNILFSLFGWELLDLAESQRKKIKLDKATDINTDYASKVAYCKLCFRKVPLWNLKVIENIQEKSKFANTKPTENNSLDNEIVKPLIFHDEANDSEKRSFDVEWEHREYCPWIKQDKNKNCKAGWEVTIKSILKKNQMNTTLINVVNNDDIKYSLSDTFLNAPETPATTKNNCII
ncbi:Nuclear-interacting partner of ALK [Clydaea vesicula]|uniref:Nuclear-interacting partner of ALK n=1 Tax=Clydaea vesicula TaxID=447962 RepID=A0AAD5U405_9FUNG|nr:Nuclear-interacting partner of ALK [Clydaea vesicula]